jgi:hemolysin activation/secretion protein/AraC-like DNA-binding protein
MAVEQHLILQNLELAPCAEWQPHSSGWRMARVAEGAGYWLQTGVDARQLGAGDCVLTNSNSTGVLRASQLGPLKLQYFIVQPQYLNGLLTVLEWHRLEVAPEHLLACASFFSAGEPIGEKFARLAKESHPDGLLLRCGLLQLWANAIAGILAVTASGSADGINLRDRFRRLVGQMPEVEFSESSLGDLARQLHCGERHFTRLFREEFGVPFRARQIELRLQRARHLLANSDAKIINVACDSGYQHLGLFNMMFKRRFGMTPSEWRKQNQRKSLPQQSRGSFANGRTRVGVLLVLFVLNLIFTICSSASNATATVASNAAPRFDVRAYAVKGNTLLSTNILAGIFSRHSGTNMGLEEIVKAAADLQMEYRNEGYPRMSVAFAQEQITNGIVTMNVFSAAVPRILVSGESYDSSGKRADLPVVQPELPQMAPGGLAAATNAGPRFTVSKYLVMGNTILSPEAIDMALTNIDVAYGTNVSMEGIRKALAELRAAYRERGYVTVSVALPQQKLTNGVVKVQVTEGLLAAINVTGNHYYSSNNVMRALPSLHTNMLLNSHLLQRELDNANANRDRQIYPVIGPGPEPGTSELTLKVKEQFPLHSRLEVNNQGPPGTPDLRVNFNAQYDNLWDMEHQVGLQYGFSPEQFRVEPNYLAVPLDDPLIANYSGYYRLPLGDYSSVAQQVEANPGSFGYNEVTHKFNLPPATGRPELNFYASRSTSDTGVQYGPASEVLPATNHLVQIISQTTGDNVTLNQGAGGRLSLPLKQLGAVSSTLSFGVDYKLYEQASYNTNNFYVNEVITNSAGQQTNISTTVSSGQKARYTTVVYLPINAGWNGSVPDAVGTTYFNAQANCNVPDLLFVNETDAKFGKAAYTTNARASYVTVQMGVDRSQNIYKDWSVKVHADGQWADGPLISNEQYAMGGSASVRGYQDGQAYGDTGWRVSVEPQTPLYNIGMLMVGKEGHGELCWVRASVFCDYGGIHDLGTAAGAPDYEKFCGAGFGFTANIGNHVDGRLAVAWPLIGHKEESNEMRVYFGVGGQF